MSSPLVTSPVKVVENETITISEYFGRVASADGTASFAVVDVRAADAAAFQTPQFAEYVICNSGAIDLEHSDGEIVRLNEGEGAFLPAFLRLKWKFPGPCNYTVGDNGLCHYTGGDNRPCYHYTGDDNGSCDNRSGDNQSNNA